MAITSLMSRRSTTERNTGVGGKYLLTIITKVTKTVFVYLKHNTPRNFESFCNISRKITSSVCF